MSSSGMTGILKVTPNRMVDILYPLIASGETVPTTMFWGPPGVGKSDSIKTLAKRIKENTGKEVFIRDVRLLLFNPVDLRGIPVPGEKETVIDGQTITEKFAIWLKPQIFDFDPSPNVINILFLDEITAAPQTVQASAYQLTLDRKVGEHKLPDNVIILAAGNRLTDKGVVHKMPTPLANRMAHFEIYADIDDWKDWAIPNNIHQLVLGFLNYQSGKLHQFDPTNDAVAFPTPRSWASVSKYLHIYGNLDAAYPMIAGTIGEGLATEFKAFCKTYGELPSIDDICAGRKVTFDKRPDVCFSLSSALTSRAVKTTDSELKNIVTFTMKELSREFSILTMKDILRIEKMKERLMFFPEWVAWAKENKLILLN